MVCNYYVGLLFEQHNFSSVVLHRQDQQGSKLRRGANYRHVIHPLLPSRNTVQKEEFYAGKKVSSASNVSFTNYRGHPCVPDRFCCLLGLSLHESYSGVGSCRLVFSVRRVKAESSLDFSIERGSFCDWALLLLNRAGGNERKSRSKEAEASRDHMPAEIR
jgi:hypothetical protein